MTLFRFPHRGLVAGLLLVCLHASLLAARADEQLTRSMAKSAEIPVSQLEQGLARGSLRGYIHAANQETQTYALMFLDPEQPGTFRNIALIPGSETVWTQFLTLHRFDEVTLEGAFLQRPYPQVHMLVTALTINQPWLPAQRLRYPSASPHVPDISAALEAGSDLLGQVHAVAGDGHVLMLDYRDTVLPVVVPDSAMTRNLWRGDIVRVRLSPMSSPDQPRHMMLETFRNTAGKPLEVLDAIRIHDNEPTRQQGVLVFYPKNPVFGGETWGLQVSDDRGIKRIFLLQSPDADDLHARLQSVWEVRNDHVIQAHHKWVNDAIRLEVSGRIRVTDPNQPNPVIELRHAGDVRILEP